MATTCQSSTLLYSWWSENKWITNHKRTKIQFNQQKLSRPDLILHYKSTNTQQRSIRPNQLKSTILFITILVLSLLKPILSDNQLRAPVIIEQPVDVTVRRNDPATLNCKTEGFPLPSVEWFKDNIKIKASKNPMILPSGSLFFFQVDQKTTDKFHNTDKYQFGGSAYSSNSDTGVYWCEATNKIGKVRSRNATLSLAMLNHNFQLEPQNLSLPSGQMAIFHCSSPRGVPAPRIYWKKDDQIVRAGFGRVQQLSNGSLIVNEVRKTDEGKFVCVAENMLGMRESSFATLTVYVKPNFVQSPEDVTAKIGDRVRFQCIVDGDPRPILHWRKENGQMPANRIEVDPQDNSLVINNIEQSDDGFYICEAANLIGNNSAGASLIVHSSPIFQVVPGDITASLNGVAKLPCAVSGNPQPNLFWSKEGNQALLFPGNSNGRFSVTQSGHLTITDLQVEDTGFYVCSAVSVVGSAMAKAHIKVTSAFEGPPPIIRFGPANQTLPTETIALIFCEVLQPVNANENLINGQTFSKVKVSWLKDNKPISGDRRFVQLDSGTLQINNLQTNDTGIYTCIASYSEEGNRLEQLKNNFQTDLPTSNWSAMLQVESPRNPNIAFHRQPEFSSYPTAPFKPVIINFTNTEVTISWRKVQEIGSSPLIGYRLEYYDADSPKPNWILASNRIFTEIYTVKHLQPNTRYVFQVRGENSHGLSAPSPLSNVVQTLKFAPNRLNPSLISNSHHHKDLDDIRAHLNGIQVILEEAKPMTANSIKLIWKLVHRDQNLVNKENIEGYYIRFRDVGPDLDELQNDLKLLNRPSLAKMTNTEHQKYNMLTVLTSGSNVNSYVISDLSEFTLYELFLVPFYKSVDGPPSNSKLVRTLADLPSAPPAEVKAHLLNLTTISVHWKPVPKPQRNGIIQAYNVMLIPIRLANSTTTTTNQASLNNNLHATMHNPNHHLFNHQNIHFMDSNNNIPAPHHYLDSMQPYLSNQQFNIEPHNLQSPMLMNTAAVNLYPNTAHSSIFPLPPVDFQDNNDLSSAALLSRNAPIFNSNNLHSNEPSLHSVSPVVNSNFQQQILLNQLSRNITTNANTHQLTISGLQPGAIYQLRIAAANTMGYGPASVPILLQMTAEYIIEGADREELDANNLDESTKRHTTTSFNRDLFNSKIITITFTISIACLLIGAACFVINRRNQNINKYDKTNSTNKTKFSFASSTTKNNKLANDLFSNHPMITANGDSPNDALWIDRNWLATQNLQTTDYPLLKNDRTLLSSNRIDHRSKSSAIYASTSQLNCSRPSINNQSNGEYCALQSQNDYAEVSELGGVFTNSKLDTVHTNNNNQSAIGYALNNIGTSKSSNSNVLMPSNAYATTTLINLNQNVNIVGRVNLPDNLINEQVGNDYPNYGENDFHCQNSLLYEHNSSIEPTSSTLLLQRTPSESGSYTTDEYSYRRNGSKQQLKNQSTIERNKKKSKKSNYNNGTLCSKSSTASSHISEHSKVSNIQQTNKSNIFLLNELPSSNLQTITQHNQQQQDLQDSPPSPAPNHPFNQISNQRIFTTAINQPNNNNYNVYEQTAYDTNLYGGINRFVQLGNRQHHTLNNRQLNNQQRKNQQRPVHNRVQDFIELNSDLNGSNHNTMNLISNPLHHNNPLQGSLPSLVNNGQDSSNVINNISVSNNQQTHQSSMMKKMLNKKQFKNKQTANNRAHQLNSEIENSNMQMINPSLNRSNSSLVSESDNFYCDIEEAQQVQSDFRAKLNAQNQMIKANKSMLNRYPMMGSNKQSNNNYPDVDSGEENDVAEDLLSENDKLLMNKDENKLIVRHGQMQDEDDLTDQYSDYESIDNMQSTTMNQHQMNRLTSLTNNDYLRKQKIGLNNQMNKPTFSNNFNTTTYNQRLTPVNLMNSNPSSASSLNETKQYNLSLARKNQLTNNQLTNSQLTSGNQFSNSQPGLFRFKDNGSFSTMQTNLNNGMIR